MGIFNDNSQNDHYGHFKVVERGPPGPAGTGFELTDKGNYDIDGKRLTDVSKPVDGTDAATKAYVDEKTSHNTCIFSWYEGIWCLLLSCITSRIHTLKACPL